VKRETYLMRGAAPDPWTEYTVAHGLGVRMSDRPLARGFGGVIAGVEIEIDVSYKCVWVRANRGARERRLYARRRELGLARFQIEAVALPFFDTEDPVFDARYDIAASSVETVEAILDDGTRAALLTLNALWFEEVRGQVEVIVPGLNDDEHDRLDYALDAVLGDTRWRRAAAPYR
jgi:hypothetical protein